MWRTGPAGRRVSRTLTGLAEEGAAILPAFSPLDIVGSPYAVADYEVVPAFGGEVGLATFRQQLAASGVGIVLDFVPNHTAMDHPWVRRHPDWYVQASRDIVDADPDDWFTVRSGGRTVRLAHGRDPNYPAWPDTAQLWLGGDRVAARSPHSGSRGLITTGPSRNCSHNSGRASRIEGVRRLKNPPGQSSGSARRRTSSRRRSTKTGTLSTGRSAT